MKARSKRYPPKYRLFSTLQPFRSGKPKFRKWPHLSGTNFGQISNFQPGTTLHPTCLHALPCQQEAMVRSSDCARWCHRPTFGVKCRWREVTVARSKEFLHPLEINSWNPKNWWFVGVFPFFQMGFHVSFQGCIYCYNYLPNPRNLQQRDYDASGIKIVPVVINLLNFFEHQNDVVTWRPVCTTKNTAEACFFVFEETRLARP